MANVKFSDLAELSSIASDDLFMVTDDSEASSEKSKKATARTLDQRFRPPGEIGAFMLTSAPSGWLECDGSAVSRATYSELFAVLSDTFGAGDGSTTFNLPDLRGYFLRGYDHGAGNDPDAASRTDSGDGTTGDNIGTKQADEYEAHTHSYVEPDTGDKVSEGYESWRGVQRDASNTGSSGGNETRPKNISVMYCIKF